MRIVCISVHRSPLPLLTSLREAFKLPSPYRQPHQFTNGFFKLLLLLPIMHCYGCVDCFFLPSLVHGVMVAQIS